MCKPVQMSEEEFAKLEHLPDPVMGKDDHIFMKCIFWKQQRKIDLP